MNRSGCSRRVQTQCSPGGIDCSIVVLQCAVGGQSVAAAHLTQLHTHHPWTTMLQFRDPRLHQVRHPEAASPNPIAKSKLPLQSSSGKKTF